MRPMSDKATERTTIHAGPQRCFDVAIAFERYPKWARDVKEVTVLRRDDDGKGLEVEFRAAAMGRSTRYVLAYDYAGAPQTLSWKLVQGDIMRSCEGRYDFTPGSADTTDAVYHLAIELVVPLPGFVKRRAEVRILHTLQELKIRAESAD